MMDRVPTKVLPNGAIRYGVYDEAGNFLRYEYIKPEDVPTQEGTPFCMATMLKVTTAALCGLGANAVPDDALVILEKQLFGVCGTKGIVLVKAKTSTGLPVANMEFTCNGGTVGKKYISDKDGIVCIDTSLTSSTINIPSDYADITMTPITVATPMNSVIVVNAIIAVSNFKKVDISCIIKFSPFCKRVDFSITGGGGGGMCSYGYSPQGGAGGGGGYTVTSSFVPVANNAYPCVIGSGGAGASTSTGYGYDGGASTFNGFTGAGGTAPVKQYPLGGGAGGGYGGNSTNTFGSPTSAGGTGQTGYSSFTATAYYGGGGGGGGISNAGNPTEVGSAGGAGGGGSGGNPSYGGNNNGGAGSNGYGGGGGGASGYRQNRDTAFSGDGGSGGSGCLCLRMVF